MSEDHAAVPNQKVVLQYTLLRRIVYVSRLHRQADTTLELARTIARGMNEMRARLRPSSLSHCAITFAHCLSFA